MSEPFLVLLGTLEPSEALDSTLAFLRWVRDDRPSRPATAVALFCGSEVDRLRAVAATTVVHDPTGWTLPRVAQRLHSQQLARVLRGADLRKRLRGRRSVYVAEPTGSRLLQWLDPQAGPVVSHLHAGSPPLSDLNAVDRAALLSRTQRWIAGSAARVDELLAAGVGPEAVHELPDLLAYDVDGHPGDPSDPDVITTARRHWRDQHGIPLDARVAVGVGHLDWWQTPDAFVRVAWELVHRDGPPIHLVWAPDGASDRMLWPLRHDLRHAGLEHRVHIADRELPSWQHLAAADVVLDSRLAAHQPAGLREATAMGRPIVRFSDAEERLGAPPVNVTRIDHLDTRAMAAAIVDIVERSEHPPGDGGTGSTDTRWHPPVGGPDILALLSDT